MEILAANEAEMNREMVLDEPTQWHGKMSSIELIRKVRD